MNFIEYITSLYNTSLISARKVKILQVDTLLEESIEAFKNYEVNEIPPIVEEVKEKQDIEEQEKSISFKRIRKLVAYLKKCILNFFIDTENQSETDVSQAAPVIKKEKTKKGKSKNTGPKVINVNQNRLKNITIVTNLKKNFN